MKYELMDMSNEHAVIKVIGVGGGGGNAVSHMVGSLVEGVEFICANTDAQALRKLNIDTIIQLGVELTKGLGAGTNPEVGRMAADENKERIREVLQGADMVFLTAGMGGGTGTGAIPVIAEIARSMGILTVAVVTKPFSFEGKKKLATAELGIAELERFVDSLIIIPNQKLLPVLGNDVSLVNAFKAANDVLLDAVQGITELIVHHGMINVDFADVRTVMSGMGAAIMGTGSAKGEYRAREAAEKAIACPLL
ncbi:MAG: cell division protein FtsZ, partial [Methylobacter tundripaludum]|nr:cell division protein FtsZ [Methylobacter tundripaludum]